MPKAVKIVLWDKVNDTPCGLFSNPPMACEISFDLENHTMTYNYKGGPKTVADIAKGDVFEIRVLEGLDIP